MGAAINTFVKVRTDAKSLLYRVFGHIRKEYWPLLAVYFANGFSGFLGIAQVFWFKNELTISALDIIEITFWANLPWSCKILFSQFIDAYKIAGSRRTIYILFGALFMFVGFGILAAMANNWWQVRQYYSDYTLLVASGVTIRLGLVIQDLVADTLCIEVIDPNNPNPKAEISHIQILASTVKALGAIIGIGIGSWLAEHHPYHILILLEFAVPVISIIGVILIPERELQEENNKFNLPLFITATLYVLSIILIGTSQFGWRQELIFFIGVLLHIALIHRFTRELTPNARRNVFMIIWVIFSFRVMPSYGEGIKWWKIDELGFNPQFFGLLTQLSRIFSFMGLWVFQRHSKNTSMAKALLIISIVYQFFELPFLGMAYGLHHWTQEHLGIGAKALTLIDITGEGLTFYLVITCYNIAIAEYAPRTNRTTWFAVTSSLMSVAFSLGNKMTTKWINTFFVIERGWYDNVPALITTVLLLRAIIPTLAILLFMRPFADKRRDRHDISIH